jgi:hypothetical protein
MYMLSLHKLMVGGLMSRKPGDQFYEHIETEIELTPA